MSEYYIDPIIWFADRELSYPPAHFVTVSTALKEESKQWVLDNLKGRFCIVHNVSNQIFLIDFYLGNIAFEDPKDAVFYELKWS
jgi:hypothetical protein